MSQCTDYSPENLGRNAGLVVRAQSPPVSEIRRTDALIQMLEELLSRVENGSSTEFEKKILSEIRNNLE